MLRSNRDAAVIAKEAGVSGMTDITGFGLAGHLFEMLAASGVAAALELAALPTLPGSIELAALGERSTFHLENERVITDMDLSGEVARDARVPLLFDPQTSGGLLFGVEPSDAANTIARLHESGNDQAAIIGTVTPPRSDGVRLRVL
jgi:selenide,water dikinase